MAMRPASPAVTSGKTALPTCGALTRASCVQYDPGRPPWVGSLRASSIGETERNATPPATQTAYTLPCASSWIHGKIAGESLETTFSRHAVGSWYCAAGAVATLKLPLRYGW